MKILLLCFAAGLCAVAAQASLVANGDFETGTFQGWSGHGDLGFSGVTSAHCPLSTAGTDTCTPENGTFSAFFGNFSTGGLTQSIATTVGASYTVTYWLQVDAAGGGLSDDSSYNFSFNGTSFASAIKPARSAWTKFTFNGLVASSTSSDLTFDLNNVQDWFGLDDINVTLSPAVVTGTPEPASMLLAACGLLAIGGVRRFRRGSL